ncbi:MAG: 16S rRNA (adenine(1518)-N(6)/adenine(1519)-N(6))-dimethyltransferase RsmA [Phycisphaerales bacterium]
MQTLTDIKALLDAHGLSPKKSLGQNFLCDHNHIRKLVDDAGVTTGDLVLEVGPGTGALTDELVERGASVIACEMDDGLARLIRERFGDRVALIHGDCLASKREVNPEIVSAIDGRPFKLVANLPYNAATPLMLTLAIDHPNCLGMWVTIQKEVAERLRATHGNKTYGEVSVIAQALFEVQRVAKLPPGCFWPQPKVTSEMVALTRRAAPLTDDPRALADGAHALFAERRKQIGRLLVANAVLPDGIGGNMRAEQLSVEQVVLLIRKGLVRPSG